jgi:hypothetical protein
MTAVSTDQSAGPAAGGGSPDPAPTPLPLPPGAYDARRRYTRVRSTSITFSWRGRLLWSLPPVLFLCWLATGALGILNPLGWFLGIITIPYTIWWLRAVWARSPLGGTADVAPVVLPAEPTADRFGWPEPGDSTASPTPGGDQPD